MEKKAQRAALKSSMELGLMEALFRGQLTSVSATSLAFTMSNGTDVIYTHRATGKFSA